MEENYFPLYISMKGKRCRIYGGGEIAARRAGALLRFGAAVLVIAPEICDTIRRYLVSYPGQLTILEKRYEPGIVEADFVLACTSDPAAEEAIFQECRRKGIPVNLASDQTKCDFFFPALAEHQGLVIGVCSGGRNHRRVGLAARRLRQWLAGQSFEA